MARAALHVKLRTRLEHLFAALPSFDPQRHAAAIQRTADRAALLLAGDPATICAIARERLEGANHMIAGVAQPNWLPLRAKLGVGVR